MWGAAPLTLARRAEPLCWCEQHPEQTSGFLFSRRQGSSVTCPQACDGQMETAGPAFPPGLEGSHSFRACSRPRWEGRRKWGGTQNICHFHKEVRTFQESFHQTSAGSQSLAMVTWPPGWQGHRDEELSTLPPNRVEQGGWEWGLLEAPQKTEPETRTWGQVADLTHDFRKLRMGRG